MITVFLTFFFSLNAGYSLSKEVRQVPLAILGHLHDSATISCSHSFSLYDTILWYHQSLGDPELKLIGYAFYGRHSIDKSFGNISFKITGDGSQKAELHGLKLRYPEDSGMYYCAAVGHSDSVIFSALQKPTNTL